jgi:hypothetical protein
LYYAKIDDNSIETDFCFMLKFMEYNTGIEARLIHKLIKYSTEIEDCFMLKHTECRD